MTEAQLNEAMERLAAGEQKFAVVTRLSVDSMNSLIEYLRDNRDFFQKHLHAFDSTEELMRDQLRLLKEISAGLQSIVKASAEQTATINENMERMKALLVKVESYFGPGSGSEYDN